MVELHDLEGLFQPTWFNDSVICSGMEQAEQSFTQVYRFWWHGGSS